MPNSSEEPNGKIEADAELEIIRLRRIVAEQEERIAALEREANEFRDIEARLLQSISIINSKMRALKRAAYSA